jgi:hypothetical protein
MSSVARTFGTTISQTTKFQKVTTPCYLDGNVNSYVPIPFSYNNNTLDIHIQDNVQSDVIDDGYSPGFETEYQCKTIGGSGLVLHIGSNMEQWLINWCSNQYEVSTSAITDIRVYTPSQVIKAQFVLEENTDSGTFLESDIDDSTYSFTDKPPSSDEYVFGSPEDNYRTAWIFKTPLTIAFKEEGNQKYVTLFSNYAPWSTFDF